VGGDRLSRTIALVQHACEHLANGFHLLILTFFLLFRFYLTNLVRRTERFEVVSSVREVDAGHELLCELFKRWVSNLGLFLLRRDIGAFRFHTWSTAFCS
jgi:hypothetical protein